MQQMTKLDYKQIRLYVIRICKDKYRDICTGTNLDYSSTSFISNLIYYHPFPRPFLRHIITLLQKPP